MRFESAGGSVPMLCPGCCTLDDIPDWPRDGADATLVVGCHRCGFAFPALPGEFKPVTLAALRNHRCQGPESGNWRALGEAIATRIGELGSEQSAAHLTAA